MIDLPALNPQFKQLTSIQETIQSKTSTNTLPAKQYEVKQGDTLERIAVAHTETVQRLFDANPTISHPDHINVGQTIKIPSKDEVLTKRLYAIISMDAPRVVGLTDKSPNDVSGAFSVSGNTYTAGYCTWYVKNVRPDIPNGLGNADAWLNNAVRYGLTVGTTPQVGSVAVALNYTHVAIVQAVHGSTVTVIEMNYVGWNRVSTRVAPIGEFRYIY